jgi:hypothetical protein
MYKTLTMYVYDLKLKEQESQSKLQSNIENNINIHLDNLNKGKLILWKVISLTQSVIKKTETISDVQVIILLKRGF